MITQGFVKDKFYYKKGNLYWKTKTSNNMSLEKPFGTLSDTGYLRGNLSGKMVPLHRLVWLYHKGEWPKEDIDHINGDRSDNRIENLRKATIQQNQFNKGSLPGSSSKYKGVSWSNYRKKWCVYHTLNGKSVFVGRFNDEVEAAKAYDKAVKDVHREYGRLRYE